ncbi:putative sensor protein [Shigella sonnei]|nr:putative sensor protein [Shigella sonnei]
MIDDNNHQAAEVMSQADIACYASKNGGRGRVTVYEPQQAAAHSERAAMSLDEQWRMIKENQLMMIAHGVASPRIPEARNLWLISLKLWSCEGEIIDEQTFRRSFSDPALSHALDRRVFHEFFQQAAKAVASKGISIALPLSVAGLSSATLVNDLLEQLENSPLPPRLLHLIIPAEAILDHAESVQKLQLAGCRIVLSQVGRDLQIFNSLKANMADYLLLDGELCANVQGNLMDEMLITIIQGHAQRLGMKTIAGPVVLPLVMDTLSGIGVDLIYGDVIADAQPLDLLVNSSYFAIN